MAFRTNSTPNKRRLHALRKKPVSSAKNKTEFIIYSRFQRKSYIYKKKSSFFSEQCKEALLPVTSLKHPQQQQIPAPAAIINGMSAVQHPQIARMTPTGGRSRTCSESNVGTHVSLALANSGLLGCPSCSGSAAALHHVSSTAVGTGNNEDSVSLLEEGNSTRLPDLVAESKIYDETQEPLESYVAITLQVSIPFLIAGFGMVGAGLVLDLVQVCIWVIPP